MTNSSSNEMLVTGIALALAPMSNEDNDVSHSSSIVVSSLTRIVCDDPEKPNSDKDIVSNTESDNVPTSEQTSDNVTASKQEPMDDTSLKPKPYDKTAFTQKSDSFLNSRSNSDTARFMKAKPDDHSLSKPKSIDVSLSLEKSNAKSTSKLSKSENDPSETSIPGKTRLRYKEYLTIEVQK